MFPAPFAHYVLLERLGVGGMSEVDLARRAVEEAGYIRLVVIKRIKADRTADDAFVRMFKDEARITAELNHPNIGRVYDFGREGDEYYLVLEYVPGMDLRQLIADLGERRQKVPLRFALGILIGVCDALDHAHRKRDALGKPMAIVHRDVNPRNIMVSVRGDVKLIDFGVASATDRLERTRTDHVKGKFSYMAPEQISGEAVDARADLYAVGLTLYELLCGTGPYSGLNQIQILHKMLSGDIPKMPEVHELPDPAPLRRVYERMLQRDRKDRFQSAAELRDALVSVLQPIGGPPEPEEIAAFLRRTSPAAVDRIESKIQSFTSPGVVVQIEDGSGGGNTTYPQGMFSDSSSIDGRSLSASMEAPRPAPPAPQATRRAARREVTDTSISLARPAGILAGSAIIGVVLVSAALVLGVALLFGIWLAQRPDPTPVEPPVAVTAPAPEPEPAVVAAPAPAPDVVPEPVPVPALVPVPVPDLARVPDPVPVPEPVVDPVPEPVVDPVPEPAPAAPAPAAAEAEKERGELQISSEPRGVAIRLDGVPTGKVTPSRLQVPVGEHRVELDGFPAQTVNVRSRQVHSLRFE